MAIHQGAYTPPGGPRNRRVRERIPTYGGGRIMMHHGFPSILSGPDMGKIIIPSYFLHSKYGVMETVDAHWTGSAWKIALAKRAKRCRDCHGTDCRICKGGGAIFIPAGDTIEDYCARPGPEPGGAERKCPACQGKKCPTCKGTGETTQIVWVMQKFLRPRGRPTTIRPGHTNKSEFRAVADR